MLNRIPKTAFPMLALALLLGLYTLYWMSVADRLRLEIDTWQARQAEDGIEVTWDDMRVTGWPLRLRLELDNLRYAALSADTPWSWQTPEFHAHALPYRLDHLIAAARSPMQLTYGSGSNEQRWEVAAESAEASYVMRDGHPLRFAIDLQTVEATRLDRPAVLGAERLQIHARKVEDIDGAVDIALRGANMALGKDIAPGLVDLMGPTIEHVGVQSRVTALAGDRVFQDLALLAMDGATLQVSQGTITWGETGATASGAMDIAADGTANGRFDTTLRGHDVIIDGLIRQKLIASNMEGTLKTAMSVLSLASGADPGQLRLPLIIKNDEVFLGPVRLTSTAGDTP
jgi:hypothetical protein